MDMNSLIGTLMSADSIQSVGKTTKTDSAAVQNVLTAALPMLLNGAKEQSQGQDTAESFANALMSHGKKDTSNLSSFMGNVDLQDGNKILGHLLGSNNTQQVNAIAQQAGVSSTETRSILSAAAPLLMTLLGQQAGGSQGGGASGLITAALAAALLKNVDMGNLLGGLLGGGNAAPVNNTNSNNGGILGILGSLLK